MDLLFSVIVFKKVNCNLPYLVCKLNDNTIGTRIVLVYRANVGNDK